MRVEACSLTRALGGSFNVGGAADASRRDVRTFTRTLRVPYGLPAPAGASNAGMRNRSDARAGEASTSRLPADRAFVLQLRLETDADADPFVGRVEHIASGAAEQFVSVADLIRFVKRVLGSGSAERVSSEEER